MIRKRMAVGRLFTPAQDFMITHWGTKKVGTEDEPELDNSIEEGLSDPLFYYPRPGVLKIEGSYVYKEFITPQEIYIYVDEEENKK